MTDLDPRTAIVNAIVATAPDADPTSLDPAADLLEELELDSIDLVSIATRIQASTGVEIPESDYHHLDSLDGFVAYLTARLGTEAAS